MYRPRLDMLVHNWETELMGFRIGTVIALAAMAFWCLGGGVSVPHAAAQALGTGGIPVGVAADENAPAPVASAGPSPPPANPAKVDDLLNLDIDQLSKVRVSTASQATNSNAPSSQIDFANNALTDEE